MLHYTVLELIISLFIYQSVEATQCSHPVPEINKLMHGFHEHKLKNGFTDFLGYELIDITCDNGNTWTAPWGTEYQIPDQFLPPEVLDGDMSTPTVTKVWTSAFGKTGPRKVATAHTPSLKLCYNPNTALTFNPMVRRFAEYYLTGTFESNPLRYLSFIEFFGSHYFTCAKLGGAIKLYKSIRKSRATDKDGYVSRSLAEFLSKLEKSESSFVSPPRGDIRYFGGDVPVQSFKEWTKSVYSRPVILDGELRPISELAVDKRIRENLRKAIDSTTSETGALINEVKSSNDEFISGDWPL